jgi:hypothetical protein
MEGIAYILFFFNIKSPNIYGKLEESGCDLAPAYGNIFVL